MFTAYLQWWDRNPWAVAVVLCVVAAVLIWQAYSDVRAKLKGNRRP